MISFTAQTGRIFLTFCNFIGELIIFCIRVFANIFTPPFFMRAFFSSVVQIGWLSLPVVGITSFFTGGALALQIYAGGARFNAEEVVPSIVAIGMVRELGPVLGGLMVAARVASSIAAEIGTMKVTEQNDALTTLSTDPIKYLVVPRLVAAILTVPRVRGLRPRGDPFDGGPVCARSRTCDADVAAACPVTAPRLRFG